LNLKPQQVILSIKRLGL